MPQEKKYESVGVFRTRPWKQSRGFREGSVQQRSRIENPVRTFQFSSRRLLLERHDRRNCSASACAETQNQRQSSRTTRFYMTILGSIMRDSDTARTLLVLVFLRSVIQQWRLCLASSFFRVADSPLNLTIVVDLKPCGFFVRQRCCNT
jgi:hypothetical protein